jgi:Asp-tRNA(Asn)/Glu-tRNA(Gln) amidotransferase A subunit family amidase
MALTGLHHLSAAEGARAIREGRLSSVELVEACLARVRETDGQVEAWAHLDPDHARAQARAADEWRLLGRATGPLHGVPVGVKDVFDTADLPTEHGSPLHAGRLPERDAAAVAMLRAAGAVILGKTATTEFAGPDSGKTRNPHAPQHTPGGSSSGSAAAVAAAMVPFALGSQTEGGVVVPAAYCGVLGFKPSHGLIPRHGMLRRSATLDCAGLFARTIEDLALVAGELVGWDERDPATHPRARIPFAEVAAEEPPLTPMFAFVRTPHWERADPDTHAAFAELVQHLGDRVEEIELVRASAEAWRWHRAILDAETAAGLDAIWERGRHRLAPALRVQIERGRQVSAVDYQRAVAAIPGLRESAAQLFEQRYDAILTPAALGSAPAAPASTGDPAFCTPWTLCGLPAVSLPLMQGSSGLPLGVQLVGAWQGDARLLRTARWLTTHVETASA